MKTTDIIKMMDDITNDWLKDEAKLTLDIMGKVYKEAVECDKQLKGKYYETKNKNR